MNLEKIKNYFSPKENLKRKLTPEQFIDYERMFKESSGIMSWEKLEKYSKFKSGWGLDWIYWKWDLNLKYKPITDLSYLKSVWWTLVLVWTFVKSLSKLEEVWMNLNLQWTLIESLPNLENVWFDLNLQWTSIEDLPKLKEVWLSLFLQWTFIEILPNLENVWFDLSLQWTSIKDLPKLEYVWYDLNLQWTLIENLPKLHIVWNDLTLNWISWNALKNILKEIITNSIKVRWEIIYDWTNFKSYIDISLFLNSFWVFEDEITDEELLNDQKKEFINRYWSWKAKRDDKVKKELNILANIFYYQFVENFLSYGHKIKLMQKNWASKNEIDEKIEEIYKKLDDKFHEIEHYFWEEIKNRLLDEFRKEMKEKLTKKRS